MISYFYFGIYFKLFGLSFFGFLGFHVVRFMVMVWMLGCFRSAEIMVERRLGLVFA